jgi:magnesium transporter
VQYDLTECVEPQVDDVTHLGGIVRQGFVTWIDIEGLGDERSLRTIADLFSIHPLAMEDIVHQHQRPKTEAYEHHQLIIARLPIFEGNGVDSEQVSVFLGPQYVLTFHHRPLPVLEPVRARIRAGARVREYGTDYLAYAALDAVIDAYYPVVEQLGDTLETLEEEAMASAAQSTLRKIHHVKRDLVLLRRSLWRQREAINSLIRDGEPHISRPVRVFLRDCYDHCVQLIDVLESYRDTANTLIEIFLSSISNRTNDVMRVLTIIATIFIPLTFMTSIYGMNFEYMPELHRWWAYPVLLLLMALAAGGMIVFFYRRGWIWQGGGKEKDVQDP